MSGKLGKRLAGRLLLAFALVAALGGQAALPAYAETADESSIKINLHNYDRKVDQGWTDNSPNFDWKNDTNYWYTNNSGGINSGTDTLKFGTIQYEKKSWSLTAGYGKPEQTLFNGAWNIWHGANNKTDGVYQGMVNNQLVNDYPQLKVGNNDSLAYLFGAGTNKWVTDYTNVTGLLTKSDDGYYEFDSAKQYARFTQDDKSGTFDVTEAAREGDSTPKFTPFNNKSDTSYDYSFGMDITAQFYMPENGMVNGKPMIFDFTGDDDVWVFVDDVLVLDLGGIHGAMSGSIDFSGGEGAITYKGETVNGVDARPRTIADAFRAAGQEWNPSPYKTHTLKFFYMERGDGASNCRIRFNLPVIPEGAIEIEKEVKYNNSNEASNIDFLFNAFVNTDDRGDDYSLYTGAYEVYKDGKLTGTRETTTVDGKEGVIKLKHGETARLQNGELINRASKYYVVEIGATSDKYEVTINGSTYTPEGGQESAGATTDKYIVHEVPHVKFTNSITAENQFDLFVKKDGDVPENVTFYAKVELGGEQYRGDYILHKMDETTENKTVDTNGLIPLKKGEYAEIVGLIGGTHVAVYEMNADGTTFAKTGYQNPTYKLIGTKNEGGAIKGAASAISGDGNKTIGIQATANEGKALGKQPSMTATITNALTSATLAQGEITVKKTLSDRDWKEGDSFEFVLQSEGNAPMPTVNNANKLTIDYQNDTVEGDSHSKTNSFGKIVYNGIGTYTYLVTETKGTDKTLDYSQAQYRVTVDVANDENTSALTARISKVERLKNDAGAVTTEVSAVPLVFVNAVATDDLKLTKTVKGDAANQNEHFSFKLSTTSENVTGEFQLKYNGMESPQAVEHPVKVSFEDNGKAEFLYENSDKKTDTLPLKHGESVSVQKLPVGAEITVTEVGVAEATEVAATAPNNPKLEKVDGPSEKTFDYGLSFTMKEDGGNDVEFTNMTSHKPNLGISSNILPMAGLAAVAIAGGTALVVVERKRNASSIGDHAWKE